MSSGNLLNSSASSLDTADRDAASLRAEILRQQQLLADWEKRERQYQALFELLPSNVVLMDARGFVRAANPAFCEHIGYKLEELIGMHVSLFSRESMFSIEENIARMLAGETLEHEVTNVQKDGSLRYFDLRETVITLPDGTRGILAVSNDVTDRKVAQQKHQEVERRLLHAQKLESLGVLAGGIAHDFNNLLTVILGNLEMAQGETQLDARVRKHLLDSHKAAQRAADLTRQMLAYSGRGRFVINDIDLSQLVGEMGELLRVSISKTAVLEMNLPSPLPLISVDATQVQQVVMNLIINASEALGEKPGKVTLTTGVSDCDAELLSHNRAPNQPPPGRYVFLDVRDNGCGMDELVQERLFDPFFTIKFTGRGLGMSGVQGVVQGHKGAILLASQPGEGTTVTVLFPVAQTASQTTGNAHALTPVASQDFPRLSGTVLVAEDEPCVLRLLEKILQRLGLNVVSATNGEEAVALFRLSPDDITFALLDLTMPKMDGVKTLMELRRLRPHLKAVLSSGYNAEDINSRYQQHGFAAFLQKPYKIETIIRLVRQLCEEQSTAK